MIRSIRAGVMIGALSLGLAGRAGAAGPPVDVYLVAGQSNATGQGRLANLPAGFAPDPRVWLYHSDFLKCGGPPFTWVPLRAASESPDKFGIELSFGGRMQELTNNRPVALIKHALTYTNLSVAWDPGRDATDRDHWGPMFRAFVGTVDAGLQAMRDRGFEPTVRGMIWQQGESDADSEDSANAYAANLRHFIGRVRDQFHCPEMVFVYGFVLPPPCKIPYRDAVRTAQGAIDQDSGSVWAVQNAFAVFTDDLPHRAHDPNTTEPDDHIHLGSAGVLELGRRMAQTMATRGKTGR
jgi:hypothetical protein